MYFITWYVSQKSQMSHSTIRKRITVVLGLDPSRSAFTIRKRAVD
jgi:hypothetical protein